jgi:hypothetical protein
MSNGPPIRLPTESASGSLAAQARDHDRVMPAPVDIMRTTFLLSLPFSVLALLGVPGTGRAQAQDPAQPNPAPNPSPTPPAASDPTLAEPAPAPPAETVRMEQLEATLKLLLQ